jgi:peptide/nickel transport system substrate-binding protein
MRHFAWQWLAVSSLLLAAFSAINASAETRPEYGGTLRIAVRESLVSLDPGDEAQQDSFARRNLLALIFETLVTVDDRGRVYPALATEWQAAAGNQRWQFQIRRGVKFHDGSELTPEIAASALRMANPSWKVFSEGDFVIVERDHADADMPAELALTRNSIVKKNGGGKLSGTGPFHVEDWQAGKHLTLGAEENHWRGRAFVDVVDVEMGRNFREQALELESGKIDLMEVAPEQSHRAAMEGIRINGSQPMELIALVFAKEAATADEKPIRLALARSIERGSMRSALLQGAGQPAASLLPNWMSGYGFAFSPDADLKQARQALQQVHGTQNWTLGYDANDSLERVLAERIALNAKDAGLVLQPMATSTADVRLVRIPLATADPWIALENVAAALGVAIPKANGDSVEDLYSAEQTLLKSARVIPLFHLPVEWALSPTVKDWRPEADGSWRLDAVWIGKEKP